MIDDHTGAASRSSRLPFSQSSYIVKKKGRKPQLVRAKPGVDVEEAVAAERKRKGGALSSCASTNCIYILWVFPVHITAAAGTNDTTSNTV